MRVVTVFYSFLEYMYKRFLAPNLANISSVSFFVLVLVELLVARFA